MSRVPLLSSRAKSYHHGAVVVSCKNERFPVVWKSYLADMANLPFDLQTIQTFTAELALTFVHQYSSEICIVSAHLNIIVVIVAHEQDVWQAISICVYNYSIPVSR